MLTLAVYEILSQSSVLEITGRSSLHAITGSSRRLRGSVRAAWNDDGTLALDPPPQVHVELPVASLVSGNALVDKQMQDLVGSRSFPNIVADLTELQPGAVPGGYRATGSLELRGTTRPFSGLLAVSRSGERVAVSGSSTIDIRDWGIKPPKVLMFEVKPDVSIRLTLAAAPA
jgi:polyisoprenoid-binding protein YceI